MGKSPAKWIKTLLLGKKSSKSNLSRGKEKLVTVSMDPPTISAPILVDNTRNMVHSEMKGAPAQLPNNGANIPSLQAVGKDNAISNFGKPEDPERIRLDRAAAKAQAAFRGYLARRAFRTLKGIIKLQALIRGHLVRRQAVATLCCTWGIVKFQALARGREVRCSDIGTEVQEKHPRLPQGSKSKNPFGVPAFSQVKNLTNNVFVQKLLASSPAVLPLCLQYGPEEPNSSWKWLQRWTSSRFWESPLQVLTRSPALKTQTKGVENGLGKIKQSVWKLSNAKIENGSYSTLEHGKSKCCERTVSGNSATNTILEHPQNELEKVKRTLRKLSDSAKEVSKKSEVVNDKTKQSLKITSTSDAPDVLEEPAEKTMRDVSATLSTLLNHETDMRLSAEDTSLDEPNVCPAVDLAPAENNGKIENMLVTEELSSKDEHISDESLEKAKERRASFPAKTGNLENGLNNMRKVPSYMSPTESVKARLRSQGSPRFASEVVDKNGLNRRYSLPSSTNSNLSYLSPSGQTPSQVAGKGAIRGNKPLSSTRDASDKVARAEWRRY